MSKETDDELMLQIAGGSHRAFERLFDRHSDLIFGYLMRFLGGNRAMAEDISQATWMKVLNSSSSYQATQKFQSWLLTIARNTALTEFRKKSNNSVEFEEEHHDFETSPETLEEQLIKKSDFQALKKKIDELPDSQRVALLFFVTENMSYEDIAKELRLSVSSVKSLIFRARQKLGDNKL